MNSDQHTAAVAVVIPVYRAEETLIRCVSSLFSQTYPHWRAYLVDDCSPDGSRALMREFEKKDPRIVCLYAERNGGVSRARNAALERAEADGFDYLAFLDSDDRWDGCMLERLLDEARRTDAQIVQCEYRSFFPDGSEREEKPLFRQETVFRQDRMDIPLRMMLTDIYMNHVWRKLISADVARGLRFNEALRTAEDLEYCFRLLLRTSRYAFIPDRLYLYCRSGTGLTGSALSVSEKWRCNTLVARTMRRELRGTPLDSAGHRALARLRPLFIVFSKLRRSAAEKLHTA